MATEYNRSKIVTDNLVFFLDAGNTKSYPGTGTTWTDMSGVNNGTIDGATFNTNVFDFDGTGDYIDLGSIDSSNVLSLNNPAGGGYTISFAINWTQAGDDWPRIFNKSDGGSGTNGWSIFINRTDDAVGTMKLTVNAGSGYSLVSTSNVTPDTWQIWTLTQIDDTNGACIWYKNGISDASGNKNYDLIPTTTTDAQIGRWHSNQRRFKGKIGFVNVYDKALSAAEVKQNFDALKGRYGL